MTPSKTNSARRILCRLHLPHQDVAQNMAAFFQKVFVDQATFGQQQQQPSDEFLVADAEGGWPSTSLVDLAAELVNGTSTCEELGHQAFAFFKVIYGVFCIIILRRHGTPNTEAASCRFRDTVAHATCTPLKKFVVNVIVIQCKIGIEFRSLQQGSSRKSTRVQRPLAGRHCCSTNPPIVHILLMTFFKRCVLFVVVCRPYAIPRSCR